MVVEKVDGTELRFKNPGGLLLVVIGFLFWGVGFIDLLGHTSAEPDIFGLYSLPFFVFILLYGATIIIWLVLFFNAKLMSRVSDLVKYIQNRAWLSLIIFFGLGVALWVILEWDRWARLPGLQFGAFGLVLLAGAILLFANWDENSKQQWWRKLIAYPLIALLIIEVIVQIFAWFGVLPGVYRIGGDFYPYERIYVNTLNSRNDFANRYGWTFPDYRLNDDNKRVLVVGGSYVQALQIQPEQQLTELLTILANQNQANSIDTEFISIGLPGFGLSSFLYHDAINEIPNLLTFDEMVVLFHLGDDFQSPSSSPDPIMYSISETGEVKVDPDDARLRHDLTHYYLRGYMSFQLVETIRNNYLTPKVITDFVHNLGSDTQATGKSTTDNEFDFPRLRGFVTSFYGMTEPGHAGIKTTELEIIPNGNNFMFTRDINEDRQQAIEIADSILRTAQKISSEKGITLRLVTIPVFPDEFYNTFQNGGWEPTLGEYDLFLPEQALVEIAGNLNIPILPMGRYMQKDQLTSEQIEALFLSNEQASFTAQGHEYFATAIYSCFFAEEINEACIE